MHATAGCVDARELGTEQRHSERHTPESFHGELDIDDGLSNVLRQVSTDHPEIADIAEQGGQRVP